MPYVKKNKLVSIVFFLWIFNLSAQIFPSRNISTKDGLPNNQVESILKDSRGILWVGTNNGLSKIVNGQFTSFYEKDGLALNSVWDIIEDTNNTIWIASYGGGVTKFDGKTFKIFDEKKGLVNDFIRKLFVFEKNIFVGTRDGLSIINIENDSIKTIRTEISDFQVMDFFVYKDEIYCGTFKKGVYKINVKDKSIEKVFGRQNPFDALFSIYVDDNTLYYSIDGNSPVYNTKALKKYKINNFINNKKYDVVFGKSVVWDYAKDRNNNLYCGAWGVHTNDGGVYQIKDDTFINRSNDFGIESKNIRCLYIDKEYNTLYVGTTDMGYYKVDLNGNIIYNNTKGIGVVDIEYSKPKMYLLNKNGLAIYKNNILIKHITSSDFFNISLTFFLNNTSIPRVYYDQFIKEKTEKDIVFYKIVSQDTSYWISSNFGLFQIDNNGKFIDYLLIKNNEFEFDYKGNLIDPIPYSDLVIISDYQNKSGVFLDYQTKKFPAENPNTPANVTSFAKFNERIFIATLYKGLFLYENDYFTSLKENNRFKEQEITDLTVSEESSILAIATGSGDVYLADISHDFEIIEQIDKNLLRGNSVLFLESYKDYILIGTNKGLMLYKDGVIQFFDNEQGLQNVDFTASKVIENKLVIGTNNGYYEVKLDEIINTKPQEVRLSITDLSVNHKHYQKDDFKWFKYAQNDLTLKHNQNDLVIDYTVSEHPYPKKLLYSYQLKGIDSTWSRYSNESIIHLPYLPYGKVEVNIKVKNLNSGAITSSKLMSISVPPPFWKTWWFRLSLFIIIGAGIIFIYKKRVKNIKERELRKSAIQKRLVETKMEALQSQMNPHFIFNAINSIQNYIIDHDIDNSLRYLGEFAKLIRKTLDNSSQQFISLAEEISYLESYILLENMRFDNKVKIEIKYDDIPIQEIDIPPMLLQPLIENAFVHAFSKKQNKPKLSIEFTVKDKILTCKIADNGTSISDTTSGQIHQPKGLKLFKERISLINKSHSIKFEIKSKEGEGTTILLQIQLS